MTRAEVMGIVAQRIQAMPIEEAAVFFRAFGRAIDSGKAEHRRSALDALYAATHLTRAQKALLKNKETR